jgi:hypothetical protein
MRIDAGTQFRAHPLGRFVDIFDLNRFYWGHLVNLLSSSSIAEMLRFVKLVAITLSVVG